MLFLDMKVTAALEKIHFVKRYERLSNTFNSARTPLKEILRYIDGENVMECLAR